MTIPLWFIILIGTLIGAYLAAIFPVGIPEQCKQCGDSPTLESGLCSGCEHNNQYPNSPVPVGWAARKAKENGLAALPPKSRRGRTRKE